ncbi:MAG: hypothetical protein GY874_10720 [Desulfobacteraceae bacterium]|nr:hypothetical protein [Desulfobacteraceae bacterium]
MIQKCSFGKMTINGRKYGSDLKIQPNGKIIDTWWRDKGHLIEYNDISDLIAGQPDIIVAGTGVFGMMKICEELKERLSRDGIQLVAKKTKQAAATFNELLGQNKKVAACFHLTC